jgi:nuclear pore complex protein Nup160
MESGELLVAAQLTSVYPSTQITAIPIQTSRQNAPLPPVPKANDPPVEHAIYSTSLYAPILGTVILRVLHQGLILELLSISNDITIRFVFPSPVLSFPAIFLWQGTELHVIAVTSLASVYRLVLPVGAGTLWHEPFRSNWCREYLIRNVTEPFDGLVHVQGTHCVIIGHKNGSLLRIETEFLGDERLDGTLIV